MIDAISYTLDRTYGPGTTSFRLRSGVTPGVRGGGTSSGRHTPLGAGAGDFQIYDASGQQMAGQQLAPFAKNWVSNFGSVGLNMAPGETGVNWTHIDFLTPDSEVKRGQDQFWTYPSGALPKLDKEIQGLAGTKAWLDGLPPDEAFTQLDAAANYIREVRVQGIEPGKLASLWGRDPLDAPVTPANVPNGPAFASIPSTEVNPAEAEKLAGVMLAEARGEGRVGMLGVGWTAVNRLDEQSRRFPDSLDDVLTEYAAPVKLDLNDPIHKQALEDAKGILARDDVQSPNPVGSAVYFHNPDTSKANLVKQQTDSGEVVATIGDHVFVDNSKYLQQYGGTAANRQATLPPMPSGVTFAGDIERAPDVTPVSYAVATTPDETFTTPREARTKSDREFSAFAPLDIRGWADTGTPPGASASGTINTVRPFDLNATMTGGPAKGASADIALVPDAPPPRPRPAALTGWGDTGTTPGASAAIAFRPLPGTPRGPTPSLGLDPGPLDLSGNLVSADAGGPPGASANVAITPFQQASPTAHNYGEFLSNAAYNRPSYNSNGLTAADMAFKPLSGVGNWSPTSSSMTPPVYAQDKPSTYYNTPIAEQRIKDDNIYDLGGQPYDTGPTPSSVTASLTPPIDPVLPEAPTNIGFQPIGEPMDITPKPPAAAAPPPTPAVVKPFAPPPAVQAAPRRPGGLFGEGGLFANSPLARIANALFGTSGGGQAGNVFAFTPSVGGTSPGGTPYVAGWGTGSGPAGGWTTQWVSSTGKPITTRENPYTGVQETIYG